MSPQVRLGRDHLEQPTYNTSSDQDGECNLFEGAFTLANMEQVEDPLFASTSTNQLGSLALGRRMFLAKGVAHQQKRRVPRPPDSPMYQDEEYNPFEQSFSLAITRQGGGAGSQRARRQSLTTATATNWSIAPRTTRLSLTKAGLSTQKRLREEERSSQGLASQRNPSAGEASPKGTKRGRWDDSPSEDAENRRQEVKQIETFGLSGHVDRGEPTYSGRKWQGSIYEGERQNQGPSGSRIARIDPTTTAFVTTPGPPESFSKHSHLCLDGQITGQSRHVVASGGHADIWTGFLRSETVAIKVTRPFSSIGTRIQKAKLLKRLWREYLAWSCLSHPNILQCLGFSYDFTRGSQHELPSLVSHWMSNGTALEYIEDCPNVDRIQLLAGIASGLLYLHNREPAIVHGDLRAGNILVSDTGEPRLTDFGLARILTDTRGMTTSSEVAGSLRWMSQELLRGKRVNESSDVWAYGMTVLEIWSGKRPYHELTCEPMVLHHILLGQIPARPVHGTTQCALPDDLWNFCQRCWNSEPTHRPPMREVSLKFTAASPQAAAPVDVDQFVDRPEQCVPYTLPPSHNHNITTSTGLPGLSTPFEYSPGDIMLSSDDYSDIPIDEFCVDLLFKAESRVAIPTGSQDGASFNIEQLPARGVCHPARMEEVW